MTNYGRALANRLSSLVTHGLLAAMLLAMPAAEAQDQTGNPGDASSADCNLIPGGNAPISRIARLEGGLSVRNLNLTYLGKTLEQLTDQDFRYLEELWPICGTYDEEVSAVIALQARKVINEAKATQAATRDWIKAIKTEVEAMRPTHDAVVRIHNIWQELINRELDMTSSEFDDMTAFMTTEHQALYDAHENEHRTLVRPFDPGPTDVRDPYK